MSTRNLSVGIQWAAYQDGVDHTDPSGEGQQYYRSSEEESFLSLYDLSAARVPSCLIAASWHSLVTITITPAVHVPHHIHTRTLW